MKITVIGGGSTYSPELLEGLIHNQSVLGLKEVVLYDIWKERLEVVGRFCQRMAKAAGSSLIINTSMDLKEALKDCSFIVQQIRVGGWQGRHDDIMMGLRYNIVGQETTGVGGFAKATRTIPVILEIAKSIEKYCPKAWVINFTNPSAIITETLLRYTDLKVIGLCNVPVDMKMQIAEALKVEEKDMIVDYVGLNHLAWIRDVKVQNRSRMPDILKELNVGKGPANIPELEYPPGFLKALGKIPCSYLAYYYGTEKMIGKIRHNPLSRAQEVAQIEDELMQLYLDENVKTKPDALDKRGGAWYSRIAVDLIKALTSSTPSHHIINVFNNGLFKELSDNAVVEVTCEISDSQVKTMPVPPLDEDIAGLIGQVKAYERLTIEAGVTRSKDKAFMALVNHPLVPDAFVAYDVLEYMIKARGYDFQ